MQVSHTQPEHIQRYQLMLLRVHVHLRDQTGA